MIIIIIISLIIQSTILPYFSFLGYLPNITLVVVVSIALLKGRYYGGFFGLCIGLIQDILFSTVIGINGFIYFILGFIIGYIQNTINNENLFIPAIFTFVSTIFFNLLYYFFMYFLSRRIDFSIALKHIFSIEILYNCILSVLIYKLLSKIFVVPSLRFGKR
nr:rod shape-determining protein MreD [Wansuia hejianensis]